MLREPCSAAILAGGRSRRMGRSKAWLEFAGRPLLQWLAERLTPHFEEVLVVGAPGEALPEVSARVVYDDVFGEGPVAGIETALREARTPWVFITTCDAPFLRPELAKLLEQHADGVDLVEPVWRGKSQPLSALYRTDGKAAVSQYFAAGGRRATGLESVLRTRQVDEETLARLDPGGASFFNVNTPAEYAAAVAEWELRVSASNV